MDSSKCINLPVGIDNVEVRDRLYYNKYQYRATFCMFGIRRTSFCRSEEEFDWHITNLLSNGWTTDSQRREIKRYNRLALDRWILWRTMAKKSITVRIEGDTASVFSNDLNLLKSLDSISNDRVTYTQAKTGRVVAGVKYFSRQPAYQYRVYMKQRRLTPSLRTIMSDFFEFHKVGSDEDKPLVSPSDSLIIHVKQEAAIYWRSDWLQTHHFIDFDDESTMTMMVLKFGELLGEHYRLEKRQPLAD